jgi:radical SAM protein
MSIHGVSPRGPESLRWDLNESPRVVFYEITRACDLVCQHCRACAESKPHPAELRPDESRRLVEQVAQFPQLPWLVLTGGDPLKRRDVVSLVEYAADRRLRVALTPAATPLVTRTLLAALRRAGLARLAVSLDAADAATHDSMRGVPGAYQRTLEIMDMARALGLPLQVNTTVTPENHRRLDALAELLAGQGIVLWSVFFLVPVGRAWQSRRLSAEEYEEVFATLYDESQRRPYAIKTTEAPQYRRYVLERGIRRESIRRAWRRWDAFPATNDGKGIMFVGHTGLIYPSGFMPLVCGLFGLDHLVAVYQRSPIFRALRDADRLEGKCRACEYRHICGGSRARAYAVTGNPFAQEPDCNFLPRALRGHGRN